MRNKRVVHYCTDNGAYTPASGWEIERVRYWELSVVYYRTLISAAIATTYKLGVVYLGLGGSGVKPLSIKDLQSQKVPNERLGFP